MSMERRPREEPPRRNVAGIVCPEMLFIVSIASLYFLSLAGRDVAPCIVATGCRSFIEPVLSASRYNSPLFYPIVLPQRYVVLSENKMYFIKMWIIFLFLCFFGRAGRFSYAVGRCAAGREEVARRCRAAVRNYLSMNIIFTFAVAHKQQRSYGIRFPRNRAAMAAGMGAA